jgi:hypothetical protein
MRSRDAHDRRGRTADGTPTREKSLPQLSRPDPFLLGTPQSAIGINLGRLWNRQKKCQLQRPEEGFRIGTPESPSDIICLIASNYSPAGQKA